MRPAPANLLMSLRPGQRAVLFHAAAASITTANLLRRTMLAAIPGVNPLSFIAGLPRRLVPVLYGPANAFSSRGASPATAPLRRNFPAIPILSLSRTKLKRNKTAKPEVPTQPRGSGDIRIDPIPYYHAGGAPFEGQNWIF